MATDITSAPDVKNVNGLPAGYGEIGVTGLKRFSGYVQEEFLQALQGRRASEVYREMRENDAVINALLFAIEYLARQVTWRVAPASEDTKDTETAKFIETCLEDMSSTWADTVAEILSFIPYGYSWHEIVYKRRGGPVQDEKKRSKYSDGKIAWRKVPIRAQDSLLRWEFDESGGIQGMVQLAPPKYVTTTIPILKSLLFRTTTWKGNPEGRSLLRGAYRSWFYLKRLQEYEAIGVERDLAGYPMLQPRMDPTTGKAFGPDIWNPNDPEAVRLKGLCETFIRSVRRDEQEGAVLPAWLEFKLVNTGSRRQYDTNQIINRYEQRIAMIVLADFILLGSGRVGSFSLVESKTELFRIALSAFLDSIAEVFNRYAIPRLLALNGLGNYQLPILKHGDVATPDIGELGSYLQQLSGAGFPLFPEPELENALLAAAKLPTRDNSEVSKGNGRGPRGPAPGEPRWRYDRQKETLTLAVEDLRDTIKHHYLGGTEAAKRAGSGRNLPIGEEEGHWVTIRGRPVFIREKGPARFADVLPDPTVQSVLSGQHWHEDFSVDEAIRRLTNNQRLALNSRASIGTLLHRLAELADRAPLGPPTPAMIAIRNQLTAILGRMGISADQVAKQTAQFVREHVQTHVGDIPHMMDLSGSHPWEYRPPPPLSSGFPGTPTRPVGKRLQDYGPVVLVLGPDGEGQLLINAAHPDLEDPGTLETALTIVFDSLGRTLTGEPGPYPGVVTTATRFVRPGAIDLVPVSVPGTNVFCTDAEGLDRVKMPQLATDRPRPGSPADALPRNAKGWVDAVPQFLDDLQQAGVGVSEQVAVPPASLKASQGELDGSKVAGMLGQLGRGGTLPGTIVVSADNYVLDGHHRWAAQLAQALRDGTPLNDEIPVTRVHLPIMDLLKRTADFANRMGIPNAPVFARPRVGKRWVTINGRHVLIGEDESPAAHVDEPDEGFTIQPVTGETPRTGYAVALPGRAQRFPAGGMSSADFAAYVITNADVLTQPGHYMGGWNDPADGSIYLDVSLVTPTAAEAERLAEAHGQLAYYDFEHGRSVPVGRPAVKGDPVVQALAHLAKMADAFTQAQTRLSPGETLVRDYERDERGLITRSREAIEGGGAMPIKHVSTPSVEALAKLYTQISGGDELTAEDKANIQAALTLASEGTVEKAFNLQGEPGHWVTIRGNRVFIREGRTRRREMERQVAEMREAAGPRARPAVPAEEFHRPGEEQRPVTPTRTPRPSETSGRVGTTDERPGTPGSLGVEGGPGMQEWTPPTHPVAVGPVIEDTAAQQALRGPIKDMKAHGGGVNKSMKVTFADGSQAMWKPGPYRNIYPLPDPDNEHEQAAADLAHLAGLDDMVPAAVIREINGVNGSLQAWMSGQRPGDADVSLDLNDGARALGFDYVIGNYDRHGNNWLIQPDGTPVLIDNGLSFPGSSQRLRLRNDWEQNVDGRIPAFVSDAWRSVAQNWDTVAGQLSRRSGLSQEALTALHDRITAIVAGGVWSRLPQWGMGW